MKSKSNYLQRLYLIVAVICLIVAAVFIFLPSGEDNWINLIIALVMLLIAFVVLTLQRKLTRANRLEENNAKLQSYLDEHCNNPQTLYDKVLVDFRAGKLISDLVDKIDKIQNGGIYEDERVGYAIGLEVKKDNILIVVEIEPVSTKISYSDKNIVIDYVAENISETAQLYERIITAINESTINNK